MALPMVPQMFKNHSQVICPVSSPAFACTKIFTDRFTGSCWRYEPPPPPAPNIFMHRFDKKRFLAVSSNRKVALFIFLSSLC